VAAIRPACELEGQSKAEAKIVVAVVWIPVVAVSGAAVLRIVVPATAAVNTIRAL